MKSNKNQPMLGSANFKGKGNKRRASSVADTNVVKEAPTGSKRRALSIIDTNVVNEAPTGSKIGQSKWDHILTPMSLKHTKNDLEEIDRTVEAETKTHISKVENSFDIESYDERNPLAVVEYRDDIYNFYKKEEECSCVDPNYMEKQDDINYKMRGIVVDWLIEVHYKQKMVEEGLYLTVNVMDRFLAIQQVQRNKLQLVGLTAFLIACKYEEVLVPAVSELILVSDKAYTRKEILEMEKLMLNKLQFKLSVPTVYMFMRRFLKEAQCNRKTELLSFYIIDLCLVQYDMLRFLPSLLSAAAIFTAQCVLNVDEEWSSAWEIHTNYSQDQLMECSRLMVALHKNSGLGKLTGVFRKYNTSRYGFTAKI